MRNAKLKGLALAVVLVCSGLTINAQAQLTDSSGMNNRGIGSGYVPQSLSTSDVQAIVASSNAGGGTPSAWTTTPALAGTVRCYNQYIQGQFSSGVPCFADGQTAMGILSDGSIVRGRQYGGVMAYYTTVYTPSLMDPVGKIQVGYSPYNGKFGWTESCLYAYPIGNARTGEVTSWGLISGCP